MNEKKNGMETYMTVEEVAAYLKLAVQTIRKYVLNKTIPYRKIQKSVRFRLSEIESWIDHGCGSCRDFSDDIGEGDLFADPETGADAEGGEIEGAANTRGGGEEAGAGQTGEAQI